MAASFYATSLRLNRDSFRLGAPPLSHLESPDLSRNSHCTPLHREASARAGDRCPAEEGASQRHGGARGDGHRAAANVALSRP